MDKPVEILQEITNEEAKLADLYWNHISGHTKEEYNYGLDCENEIEEALCQMYEENCANAPEQVPYMDPTADFDPDEVVKQIAERDQIPAKAVYDAIDLVYNIREYYDLHEKIYGVKGSVMFQ